MILCGIFDEMIDCYNIESLKKKCHRLGVELSEEQVKKFVDYYELLVEWNSFMNLTAITDFEEVVIKHFVDSLAVFQVKILQKALNRSDSGMSCSENISVIDVGTGAGFPGIPLKIVFPDLKVTLLDSLNKRVKFLNETIKKINLKEIETIHGRAEDLARQGQYREQYDFCISRAVANLSTLSELCIPFIKTGGYFISYKSEKVKEELSAGEKAIKILGGKIECQLDYLLPDTDIKRSLLVVKKEKNTFKKYPRKAGTPLREPI